MKEKVFIVTQGIVIKASKQWWLKINTKMFRTNSLDGAIFPYIIKVEYIVNDKKYYVRKWISAGLPVPEIDSQPLNALEPRFSRYFGRYKSSKTLHCSKELSSMLKIEYGNAT